MDDIADEQLLDKYAELGELRYFDALTRRHVGKVRAMIYPMVLNDADADELTQDVFMRVVRNIHGFDRRAAFSTWLHQIAMNIPDYGPARVGRRPQSAAGAVARSSPSSRMREQPLSGLPIPDQ
ncbi:MAG: sigma factor [bacterium]